MNAPSSRLRPTAASTVQGRPGMPAASTTARLAHTRPPRFTGLATLASRPALSMAPHRVGSALKRLDFKDLGQATLDQIKLIYGLCILSRIYNAAQRSKNEVREVAIRDSLGFGFWFFATPMIQRLFLKTLPPKPYRDALVQATPNPTKAQGFRDALSLSTTDKLRYANWRLNPISHYTIPSSKQVNDQMAQALNSLERAGYRPGSITMGKLETHYKHLLKWRNLATGAGTLITIALLGVGINMYNIYLTNKNRAAGQIGK